MNVPPPNPLATLARFTTLIACLDGEGVQGSRVSESKLNYFVWIFLNGRGGWIWRGSNYF